MKMRGWSQPDTVLGKELTRTGQCQLSDRVTGTALFNQLKGGHEIFNVCNDLHGSCCAHDGKTWGTDESAQVLTWKI